MAHTADKIKGATLFNKSGAPEFHVLETSDFCQSRTFLSFIAKEPFGPENDDANGVAQLGGDPNDGASKGLGTSVNGLNTFNPSAALLTPLVKSRIKSMIAPTSSPLSCVL